jgi:CHAT domain-containing protein
LFGEVCQKPVDRLTEEDVNAILPRQRAQMGVCIHTGMNNSMKKPIWKNTIVQSLAAACVIVLVMFATGYNLSSNKIDSTISIDVNPSIEITTNKSNKVIEAVALNDDAKIILDGMDLKKVNLDVAIDTIMGSMVKNGYINVVKDSILVTVDNDDEEKAAELQESISSNITTALEENHIQAIVYKQKLTKNIIFLQARRNLYRS